MQRKYGFFFFMDKNDIPKITFCVGLWDEMVHIGIAICGAKEKKPDIEFGMNIARKRADRAVVDRSRLIIDERALATVDACGFSRFLDSAHAFARRKQYVFKSDALEDRLRFFPPAVSRPIQEIVESYGDKDVNSELPFRVICNGKLMHFYSFDGAIKECRIREKNRHALSLAITDAKKIPVDYCDTDYTWSNIDQCGKPIMYDPTTNSKLADDEIAIAKLMNEINSELKNIREYLYAGQKHAPGRRRGPRARARDWMQMERGCKRPVRKRPR